MAPLAVPASAQTNGATERPEVQLERVEIRGRAATDTDQRRESTAAKTVVGREEIERYGDTRLSDVLKRLPGVTIGGTPGRGGEIRMRGMGGGYTQILVNGERASGGLSVDNLTPEQVERIEVYRAPTAETGAQAIAGTINIVLRDDVRRRLSTLNASLGWADDRWQPMLTGTRADRIGRFSYNVSGTLMRTDRANTSDSLTVVEALDGSNTGYVRDEQRQGRTLRDALYFTGRLQWKQDSDSTLSLQQFLMYQKEADTTHSQMSQSAGSGSAPYDRSLTDGTGHFAMARSNAEWKLRLPDTAQLELNAGFTASESVGASRRTETQSSTVTRQLNTDSDAQERWRSTRGKYSRWVGTEHQWAAGWELEDAVREEGRTTDQPLPARPFEQDSLRADALRTALWGQDEWKLSPQWALHGGLRWEAIRTRSDWLDTAGQWQRSSNRSAVWSPLFHLLWRPAEESKNQVRMSLTRSYRAARPSQLTAQRVYTRDFDIGTANTPNSPDRLGNPALKPELSTGLDLAYEHYLAGGGLLSASVFHRQISDYIRNVIFLDATGRYVTQPQNVGRAHTSGIELEAKFRPKELWTGVDWPLDLRGSVSFFRSSVDGVPGPNNRLDRQPNYTLNLGGDYKLRSMPLQVGGSVSLQPSNTLQVTAQQSSVEGMRRVFDAYALWTLDTNAALRLSVGNLWARSTTGSSAYTTAATTTSPAMAYRTSTVEDNTTLVSLRWELKL